VSLKILYQHIEKKAKKINKDLKHAFKMLTNIEPNPFESSSNWNTYYCSWDTSNKWQEEEFDDFHNLIPKHGTILDIGCGDGNKTERFNDAKVIGVDFSEDAIQKAKRSYPNNEWYVENPLLGLHFKDNTFDLIYSYSFLQYFSPTTYKVLMKELRRVLRPNGRILHIDVPHKRNLLKYGIHNRNLRILSDLFTNRYNDDGSRWWKFSTAKKYVKDMFFVEKAKISECWYRMDLIFWR